MKICLKHKWNVEGASIITSPYSYIRCTKLKLQCQRCAKMVEKKISGVVMDGDQVNRYIEAHYPKSIARYANEVDTDSKREVFL